MNAVADANTNFIAINNNGHWDLLKTYCPNTSMFYISFNLCNIPMMNGLGSSYDKGEYQDTERLKYVSKVTQLA